jgi:putative photosynthetic complex assembly protein 2
MKDLLLPLLFTLFVWWFSTGAILYLDQKAKSTFSRTLWVFGVIAVISLIYIGKSAKDLSTSGAYVAFMCSILVWGWIELSFLTGLITGPNKEPFKLVFAKEQFQKSKFEQALMALLHHELLIAATALLIFAINFGKPNQVALYTFIALWIMRSSAKLNLYLGVRNWSAEFLPEHLIYLKSYFKKKPMNWLFPLSVIVSSAAIVSITYVANNSAIQVGEKTGLYLVAALIALGLLEHLMMVLPVTPSALWKWALPKRLTEEST